MRILWISYYGSWTIPLLEAISRKVEVALIIPSDKNETLTQHGATIHYIEMSQKSATETMTPDTFERYNAIIKDFRPDLIHVHGTEKNLAQIQNYVNDIPIVISIQGILTGCLPFDRGYVLEEDIRSFRTLKNAVGKGGIKEFHRRCKTGSAAYEKEILRKGRYFFCRTNWDRSWVSFSNTDALIYQGEELLREEFYKSNGIWDLKSCKRHTIFMPSGFNPIKGFHIALKTLALLKKYHPDVQLVVPGLPKHILNYEGLKSRIVGEEYINYCKSLIKTYRIENNVTLLDRLDAQGMVSEMRKAHVFLSPSSIDNSPNAVGESMMIGMPIVCSAVGGTTSFMKDEENCLLTPAGDEYITAYQIHRLFEDDALASRLSQAANATAKKRHDKDASVKGYLDAYSAIINHFNKRKP